ncbi:MAG: Holliday junction DNA helicase RuvA [Candidatus Azotimanducaceae bacterium]|jgi:Holliday junction DNA helicase RuvA
MIGRLSGIILEKQPGQLLIDVGGVGYELEISLSTFTELDAPSADGDRLVSIHTHLIIRDDAHILFGFATTSERELFRTLIKVNGVGPRMALGILSGLESSAFAAAVLGNDLKVLTGLPGVGKKTAERLVIELRDKVEAFAKPGESLFATSGGDIASDVEAALIGLGYRPQEAAKAISRIDSPADDVETLIKQALKQLMQG